MNEIRSLTRLQRLLAMIPWAVAHSPVSLKELADRFNYSSPQTVYNDLYKVVQMVGVDPYGPGDYIDVIFEEDENSNETYVTVTHTSLFARPLPLSAGQALALAVACKALLSGPKKSDPLARAAEKLSRVLRFEDVGEVVLGGDPEGLLAELRDATDRRRQVRITYYTLSNDETTQRVIDPYQVYSSEGFWYVRGYCHRAQDMRVFRLDRIRELQVLDTSYIAPQQELDSVPDVYQPSADDPRVELRLAPEALWVLSRYPAEASSKNPDGSMQVTLPVSSRLWLERLLLRLGPQVELISAADPIPLNLAQQAAERVLARYR